AAADFNDTFASGTMANSKAPVPSNACAMPDTMHRRTFGNSGLKSRLIVRVFLPFVAGFFLTNLFRAINALISTELTADLALAAGDLGLLTSVYFLTMAAAQVPIGLCLDRYGPRRVETALLLVAAGGAALFGLSQGFAAVVFGRALIGLGVASGLMAGIKAVT